MSQIVQGSVTVELPDGVTIPGQAGQLSEKQFLELFPARTGVSRVCVSTADSMRKDPSRLAVPNLDADSLQSLGQQAEDVRSVIKDLEVLHVKLMQAGRLIDHSAHTALRKVINSVRALEKFDPTLSDLVPDLIEYFARSRSVSEKTVSEVVAPAAPAVA